MPDHLGRGARRLPALLNKPQYLYRPSQVGRRLRFKPQRYDGAATTTARLPWGMPIEVWPTDAIGSSIMRTGIYDLLVSEVLLRLAEPGDVAIDAGANIGQMSAVLALGSGPTGRVVSFEPHPQIAAVARRNVERWATDRRSAPIEFHEAGISDIRGTARLSSPPDFAANRGTSRISASAETDGGGSYEVPVVRLDDVDVGLVDLVKLDVEGHEAAVLAGARTLLGTIRDIVFEEQNRYPTLVTEALESAGFEILGVTQRLRGPMLVHPAIAAEVLWDPPVLVATRGSDRVRASMRDRGWRALRSA